MTFGLTPTELRVLRLLASGKTMKEIGPEMGISCKTVEAHCHNMHIKAETSGTIELVLVALGCKLITADELPTRGRKLAKENK